MEHAIHPGGIFQRRPEETHSTRVTQAPPWVDKETRKFVSHHYEIKHDGTNYTKELAKFLKEELDHHPVSSSSLAKTVHLNGSQLSEIYKNHLSDYRSWDQRAHSVNGFSFLKI
jgi:hypothetical protein